MENELRWEEKTEKLMAEFITLKIEIEYQATQIELLDKKVKILEALLNKHLLESNGKDEQEPGIF